MRSAGALLASAGLFLATGACGCSPSQPTGPRPFDFEALLAEAEATPYQHEVLSDGVVTFEEYRASFEVVIECVVAAGLEVGPLTSYGFEDRFLEFTYRVPSREDVAAADLVYTDCYDRYQQHIDFAYFMANSPTEADYAVIEEQLATCLTEAGFAVRDDADLDDLFELGETDFPRAEQCFAATGL